MPMEIYCVRCRTRTDSNEVQEVVMKNGRDAVTAVCAACGTNKFRIGKLRVEAA